MSATILGLIVYVVLHVAVIVRALTVEGKEPASRAAWILVLLFLPVVGIAIYLLFGEPWVGRSSRKKAGNAASELAAKLRAFEVSALDAVPERFQPVFRTCEALARCAVGAGNSATLSADSNAAIDAMVEDFDKARETIHISFYIWLTDRNGTRVAEALQRAARRGVVCRVIVDGVGSRALTRSECWSAMRGAGVRLCTSMKLFRGRLLFLGKRMDLRNHRKIVVVDNRITWCGSQNCADPEFRIKPRFAPWVDIMLRFEGSVALQNQLLFASDWMAEAGEDLGALMIAPSSNREGFPAIAFGTGPTSPRGAMSDVFASLMFCAEREVVISNPYFVPDPPLLAALIGCARRGVETTLILPKRNDAWVVGAISKAYYVGLVDAGVRLFEFRDGLLHAKTLIVDGKAALIGSANMDRRSLELNFENNILLYSPDVANAIRQRQNAWLADSDAISPALVKRRPLLRRIGDNIATLFGPIM